MPSTSNKQHNLMAACANGALYKKCPPLKVAREFTQADKGGGMLKRGAGGSTPLQSGMDSQLNFGQGHGHNFFSTTPLMGHAASGSLAKFAEGGEVKKPKGPSAKERREIRDLIERGKGDAVDALRDTRATLMSSIPEPANIDVTLDNLRSRLAMKDGGEVQEDPMAEYADPDALYQEYQDLMEQLQDPQLDAGTQSQMIERVASIGDELQAMGIDMSAPPDEGASP